MLSFVLHRMLCLPKITPGRCKRILTVLLTLFFFLRPGTLTILTSSSNFNVRMAIFVQRCKYTQLKYNTCVFARACRGRDVNV